MRLIIGCLLPLLAGCQKEPQPAPTAVAATAPVAAAQVAPAPAQDAHAAAVEIFNNRCTPCHGSSGKGDGPAGASLDPKPRNFTDPKWQASVTDDHIEKIFQYGGMAVGKSPAMPPNPDLTEKPDVVAALRQHIRSLGKP